MSLLEFADCSICGTRQRVMDVYDDGDTDHRGRDVGVRVWAMACGHSKVRELA